MARCSRLVTEMQRRPSRMSVVGVGASTGTTSRFAVERTARTRRAESVWSESLGQDRRGLGTSRSGRGRQWDDLAYVQDTDFPWLSPSTTRWCVPTSGAISCTFLCSPRRPFRGAVRAVATSRRGIPDYAIELRLYDIPRVDSAARDLSGANGNLGRRASFAATSFWL